MANGRNKGRKGDAGRDSGGFVALPWAVLDCPAYARLSMHARALLLEVARQFHRDDNGRMLLSRAFMETRGWKSADMLTKAKRELLEGGFIFETVKGHRPNKASWYAVTWRVLDKLPGYDAGTVESFVRGAYADGASLKAQPTRDEIYRKRKHPKQVATNPTKSQEIPPASAVALVPLEEEIPPPNGAVLIPPHGTEGVLIVPPHGTETLPTVPPHGTIRPIFGGRSVPPHGHPLEIPSDAAWIGDVLATVTTGATPALLAETHTGNSSPQQNSTSVTCDTRSDVGNALEVPPTECELVASADDDAGEDF